MRLQKEIINSINDLSILAWELQRPAHLENDHSYTWSEFRDKEIARMGVVNYLAISPREFCGAGDVVNDHRTIPELSFSISNAGLQANLPTFCDSGQGGRGMCYAILPCRWQGEYSSFLAFRVVPLGFDAQGQGAQHVSTAYAITTGQE